MPVNHTADTLRKGHVCLPPLLHLAVVFPTDDREGRWWIPPLWLCLGCFPDDLYLENNFCPDMFKCSQTLLALLVSLSSSLCARHSEAAPSKAECVSGKRKGHF